MPKPSGTTGPKPNRRSDGLPQLLVDSTLCDSFFQPCDSSSMIRAHTRHDTTRHDTTRHDTTRHDTTRHDTTRHDTTRHDTTRQDTTEHDRTRVTHLALENRRHRFATFASEAEKGVQVPL